MIIRASIHENEEFFKEVSKAIEKYIANYAKKSIDEKIDSFFSNKIEKMNDELDKKFNEFKANIDIKMTEYFHFSQLDFIEMLIQKHFKNFLDTQISNDKIESLCKELSKPVLSEVIDDSNKEYLISLILNILNKTDLKIKFGVNP